MARRPRSSLHVDRRPIAPGARGCLRVGGRPVATAAEAPWWTASPTALVGGSGLARAGDRFESPEGGLAVHAASFDADAGERRLELRCEGPQGEPVQGALARCRFADHAPREREVRAGRATFGALPAKRVELEVLHPHLIQTEPVRVTCRKGRTLAVVRLEHHHLGPLCERRRVRLASDGGDEAHWLVLTPRWEDLCPPAPPPPPSLTHHQPRYVFDRFDDRVRAAGPRPLVVEVLSQEAPLPAWCHAYVEGRVPRLQQRRDLCDEAVSPATQAWREALANVVRTTVARYAPVEASRGFLVTPPPAAHGAATQLAWPRVSPVAHAWGRPPPVLGWQLGVDVLAPMATDGLDPEAVIAHLATAVHAMTPEALLVLALRPGEALAAQLGRVATVRRQLPKGARKRLVVRCPLSLATAPAEARAIGEALPKRAALWLDLQLPAGATDDALPSWEAQQRAVRSLLAPLLATRRTLALTLRRGGALLRSPAEVAVHGALAASKKQRAVTMLPHDRPRPAPW